MMCCHTLLATYPTEITVEVCAKAVAELSSTGVQDTSIIALDVCCNWHTDIIVAVFASNTALGTKTVNAYVFEYTNTPYRLLDLTQCCPVDISYAVDNSECACLTQSAAQVVLDLFEVCWRNWCTLHMLTITCLCAP